MRESPILSDPAPWVHAYFRGPNGKPLSLYDYQTAFIKDVLNFKGDRFIFIATTQSGKSETVSVLASLFSLIYPSQRIAILAPRKDQSKDIIFERIKAHLVDDSPAIRRHVNMERTFGNVKEFSSQRFFIKNGTEIRNFTTGITETENSGSGLLGFNFTVAIIDEAQDVPAEIERTKINRGLGAPNDGLPRILIKLGTPHKRGMFYESWHDPEYLKYHVPWQKAVEAGQLSYEFVMRQKRLLRAVEFRTWYDAQFPLQDVDQLIADEWIDFAQRHVASPPQNFEKSVLGVDVARFGEDLTVFTYVSNVGSLLLVREIIAFERKDTMEISGHIKSFCEDHQVDEVIIDETGIGSGVVDRLREQEDLNANVRGFIAGAPPFSIDQLHRHLTEKEKTANRRYLNQKAYYYNHLAKAFEKGNIIIPTVMAGSTKSVLHPQLDRELRTLKQSKSSDGKMKILDEKDKGNSPDYADSLMIAVSGFDEAEFFVSLEGL